MVSVPSHLFKWIELQHSHPINEPRMINKKRHHNIFTTFRGNPEYLWKGMDLKHIKQKLHWRSYVSYIPKRLSHIISLIDLSDLFLYCQRTDAQVRNHEPYHRGTLSDDLLFILIWRFRCVNTMFAYHIFILYMINHIYNKSSIHVCTSIYNPPFPYESVAEQTKYALVAFIFNSWHS